MMITRYEHNNGSTEHHLNLMNIVRTTYYTNC